MDKVTREKRSEVMRAVRSKDTKIELVVRKLAHSMGFRFRVNVKDLPGKPDLAIKSRKKAIFVHGCFWHRHLGCKRASTPVSNQDYWIKKFSLNVERDRRIMQSYADMGWTPLVIWECEVVDAESLKRRLATYLK